MSLFLTQSDLQALTARVRPRAQRRALDRMGVLYLVRPDGHPIVTRSAVERHEAGKQTEAPQPNWSAL